MASAPASASLSRFSTWLLRPYLDLGPLTHGPLHAQRVEECWRAFAEPETPYFVAQRSLEPAFRTGLAKESGAPCARGDPRALPARLRTPRWRTLCEALEHRAELPAGRRVRLAALLHALCLYEGVRALEGPEPAALEDPHQAELAFWGAFARHMLEIPIDAFERREADLSRFEALAARASPWAPARFNAAIRVFVHQAKGGASVAALEDCGALLERALEACLPACDDFGAGLLRSRFYRAIGFLPQRRDDRAETVRIMDLAERHARGLRPSTPAQELLRRENLHALMESRTKEAFWLGDLDLALARSLEVVEVDPLDAKAWTEVGEVRMRRGEWPQAAEAYAVAAILGPPASALARHMAGVCLRKTGHPMVAALLSSEALDLDPGGISPREALARLPKGPLHEAITDWMASTIEL